MRWSGGAGKSIFVGNCDAINPWVMIFGSSRRALPLVGREKATFCCCC
ncbi:hypothetical protein HanIR_Chr16g0806151 [Helianthus annuus]|nr:hypothetical protein HanIR_Chr16g0806151 [Helianthus annuus]